MAAPARAQEVAAAGASLPSEAERDEIVAPIRQYVDAWNAHDGQTLGASFTADGDFVGISGTWWQGAEEIGSVHGELFSGRYSDSVFALDEIAQVTVLAPGVALALWRWTISQVRDEAGEQIPPL